MKKALLFVGIVLATGLSFGQLSADIAPYTSIHDHLNYDRDLSHVSLPGLDMDKINAEDTDGKNGHLYMVSRFLPVNTSTETGGTWMDVPGGKLWRLKISSTGAQALSITYDDFFIPEGAIMHVYNQDRSQVIGAFTSANNKEHRKFHTGIVGGSTSIIEYFEPDGVSEPGVISVENAAHYYRGVEDFTEGFADERGSDPCQVDVRCPEGDDWEPQIDATVRIIVVAGGGSGYCSGTVMNNTNVDCKPYVLTAFHCGDASSSSDFNQYIFYFRRQRANCGSGVVESTASMTGCTRRSHSNDGGGNTGSDYLLVELNNSIPLGYQAYYAGWNKSTTAAESGVSTHHPSGDVKKISTYTSNLINSGWGVANTHWRVYWSATVTNHGVTEGGSSGSPIWDQNGYHVGQLTGGGSFCTQTNSPDYYGKMSYNWNSNNNPTGGHLSGWLDPTNAMTGDTFDGTYPPCQNTVEETVLTFKTKLYPNPTNGVFTVEMMETLNNLRLEVYNAVGMKITTINMANQYVTNIDLSAYADGMYYVRFVAGDVVKTEAIQLMK